MSYCRFLLHSEEVEKVVIISEPSFITNNREDPLISYELKNEEGCTDDRVTNINNVNIPISSSINYLNLGDCLVKNSSKLSEADVVFFHEKISKNLEYQYFMSLSRRATRVNYIELLEKEEREL